MDLVPGTCAALHIRGQARALTIGDDLRDANQARKIFQSPFHEDIYYGINCWPRAHATTFLAVLHSSAVPEP